MSNNFKEQLVEWVLEKNSAVTKEDVNYDTPLLEQRIIKSLDIADLIFFLEHLLGEPVEIDTLEPGSFSTINNIYNTFLQESVA